MITEHSIGWLDFHEAMAPHASSLSNSNCPMAFVYADWWAARVDEESEVAK